MVLFPGLAADAAVFASQKRAFPQLQVPAWPAPMVSETLTAYCERLAGIIQPQPKSIIGGASFGGIVALEIARFLDPAAIILLILTP
jgi:thioesterase domain-containing protein